MANIVDNLITSVSLVGISGVTAGFAQLITGLNTVASSAVVTAQKLSLIASGLNNIIFYGNIAGWAAIIGGIYEVSKASIVASENLEVMRVRLNAIYGDGSKGGQAFSAVDSFIKKYGGNREDVVDTITQLEQAGVRTDERRLRDIKAISFTERVSMKQAGNALELLAKGTSTGIGAIGLKRLYGINTEDIRKQDPSAFDTSGKNIINQQKATQAIFDIVERNYGDSIKQMSHTTSAEVEKMKTTFTDLAETIANSTNLIWAFRETVIGLNEIFGFVNYLIKSTVAMFGFFGLAILNFIMMFESLIAKIFHTHNPIAKFFDQEVAAWTDYVHSFTGKHKFPKNDKFPASDDINNQSAIIREILGGGAIAKIGIKPSELPGMAHARYRNTIHVDVNAGAQKLNEGIKEIAEKTINEGIRQGALKPQFGF